MVRLATQTDLYERLASNAPSGAARFGWTRFVRALDDAIEYELGMAARALEPELAEVRG